MCLVVLIAVLSAGAVFANDTAAYRTSAPDTRAAQLVEVARGFTRPLYLTHAGDDSGRLFVVEQGGKIWIVRDGTRLNTPFMDVSGIISQDAVSNRGYTERGLLGLAFHPAFAENGVFFINYTDRTGASVVARYRVSPRNPDAADADSGVILMRIDQPFPNHNGGHMAFGHDGYLYVSIGDGGSAADPLGHGQNLNSLLGAILRIDVDVEDALYRVPDDNPFIGQSGARQEIWAYGARNIWRFSFDRMTGDMFAADVGQAQWEEVNLIPAGMGGVNLGWNVYEGNRPFSGAPGSPTMMMPILTYSHSMGISVTGGYVYRGEAIPDWRGVYLYGDFGSGIVWGGTQNADASWTATVLVDTPYTISSFGEDQAGEVYLIDYTGAIYRFVPTA
jgi:glucose/arabinose dehydrogenase